MKEEAGILNGEVSIELILLYVYFLSWYIEPWITFISLKFKGFFFLTPYCGVIDLTKHRKNGDLFSVWRKIYSCTRITGQLGTNNDVIYLNILSG